MDRQILRRCAAQIAVHAVRFDLFGHCARNRPEVLENFGAVRRAEGRERQAAVAVDDGGESLPQLGFSEARAENGSVRVAVNIQKAWRDTFSAHVETAPRFQPAAIADRGNFSVLYGKVRRNARCAASVDQRSSAKNRIKHDNRFLSFSLHGALHQ